VEDEQFSSQIILHSSKFPGVYPIPQLLFVEAFSVTEVYQCNKQMFTLDIQANDHQALGNISEIY
jgi:hypothetical protein